MPTRNLIISNLWQLVTADTNNLPLKVKNTYIPPPTIDGLSLGGVKQGTNITITADGTISASGGMAGTVTSVTVGPSLSTALVFANPLSTPVLNAQNVGAAPLTVFLRGDGTWAVPPSGGGGGSFTATAIWTGGTANKDAYTGPLVVNNQGITISLISSAGSGGITAATISLNSVPLTNTYASTGAWPNLVITIPVADLTGTAAEVAPSVAISIIGTFSGGGTNISNAGTLTNNQPIPFATNLSGAYNVSSLPYYTTTAQLNYSYSNSGAITTFAGVFTPGGNATAASGSFPGLVITGSAISGSATGAGLRGAGVSTVTLSGSVPAVPTYIPAFYIQTANLTPPTFTTGSTQTARAAAGSTINYPTPSAFTNYNWVCTQRPLANLMLQTPFGNSPLVPDVTAPAQTIAGQNFQVYGWTSLDTGSFSILVIT